jgi:hypothetical protein
MPIYVPSDLYQYLSGRKHNVRPPRFLDQNKRGLVHPHGGLNTSSSCFEWELSI